MTNKRYDLLQTAEVAAAAAAVPMPLGALVPVLVPALAPVPARLALAEIGPRRSGQVAQTLLAFEGVELGVLRRLDPEQLPFQSCLQQKYPVSTLKKLL